MRTRLAATMAALLVATMGFVAPARAGTGYTVIDLGTLGGRFSAAYGINDAGQVAGLAQLADGTFDAFVWSPATGTMQPLGFGPTTSGNVSAQGIDDTGRVVGYGPAGASYRRALVWDPVNGVQVLQALGGPSADAAAVDATGGVTGTSYLPDGATQHAFWSAGPGTSAVDLGTLSGPVSVATAINASGQVAGTSHWAATPDAQAFERHAFLYTSGTMTDLGAFPGQCCGQLPSAAAYGINDAGQVVGMSSSGTQMWQRAFMWQPSTGLVDLGWLPDQKGKKHSWAQDINNASQVVGISNGRAFLWKAGVGMLDLNALISKRSGWVLERAYAINDAGWIVGMGQSHQRTHAFLLIPN